MRIPRLAHVLAIAGAALIVPGLGVRADDAPTTLSGYAEGEALPVPLATWTNPGLGADWLSLELAQELFSGADAVEPMEQDLRVAPVFSGGVLQGYVFVTRDITDSLGFSSLEFLIAVGLRLDGTLASVQVLSHREPIIDLIMLQDLVPRFARQYVDVDIRAPLRVQLSQSGATGSIDGISSATISAVLFNEAILRAARIVARAKGIRLHDQPVMDMLSFEPTRFDTLVEGHAIGQMRITREEAAQAGVLEPDLAATGMGASDLYVYANERESLAAAPRFDENLVLDVYAGPAMTPTVGRNLLGNTWHDLFVSGRNPNDLMLCIMTIGPYSIDGEKHLSSGPFRRLRLQQGGQTFQLSKDHYRYLGFLHGTDKPKFGEIGLFWIPAATGIDPVKPWTLELLVEDADGLTSAWFGLEYTLNDDFVLLPTNTEVLAADHDAPLWLAAWDAQRINLAILLVALTVLAGILLSLDRLSRRPVLLQWVRLGFLGFVLVWLGWYAGAQVTILNVVTWLQSAISRTGLSVLLSDPLIVVLAGFVLITFFLFGRGIYCGWLCPFGALQELLGKAAQALRIRQLTLSYRTHQWLWPVKYVVLAGLVVLSFHDMDITSTAAEIEPFKTAISLRFDRTWPYVLYAVALLAAGVFVERFFCRFLCPLGAALAIGGKLRITNPLKRRTECGSPCQLCARRCPINAIAPDGAIRMDECLYCLDCQVIYHDEHVCPPLVRAKRRRVAPGLAAGAPQAAAAASD